jgi:hypothetical protein
MADTTSNTSNEAAEGKKAAPKQTRSQAGGKTAKMSPEAVYDVEAFTQGVTSWEQFDYAPELVATALKLAGKEKCTLAEAKAIVKEFAEREVK